MAVVLLAQVLPTSLVFNVLTGILKYVAVFAAFMLAVFFAFELLDINMDFNIGQMFGMFH